MYIRNLGKIHDTINKLPCLRAQHGGGGFFFIYRNIGFVISTFMHYTLHRNILRFTCYPHTLKWWDVVLQKRLAWTLFVLLLSTLMCCQPTELILSLFFCFRNSLELICAFFFSSIFRFHPLPPPPPQALLEPSNEPLTLLLGLGDDDNVKPVCRGLWGEIMWQFVFIEVLP